MCDTHLAVVDANTTYDTPGSKQLKSHLQRRTQADHFDDDIRPSAVSQFFHPLIESLAIRLEVPWLRTQ